MRILLLLGDNDEYLTYKVFDNDEQVDSFIESIEPLMMANISKELPLKERLKLIDQYFTFAGRVTGFEVIDPKERE